MGGALPDGQLPPEVRRQIMQARQDPTDRGEGPSGVGPSRTGGAAGAAAAVAAVAAAVLLGDGNGEDDMVID